MRNEFYNDFDCAFLEETTTDYRTPFQQDRDRVIYSSSFRRLQAKTQVFFSGEYDFYRTRLTHSIEVGQIGRSICNYVRQQTPGFSDRYYVDQDLVEAACLAHDLGHPPFGHAGERTLHRLMNEFGGFEGNAQTLRIITAIIYPVENGRRKGMKPTRALLDGILKYKTLRRQIHNPSNHFLYDEQAPYVSFVFGERPIPAELSPGPALNRFRSIECEIMDWADDTAYSLNDLIDGMRAGFITVEKIENWGSSQHLSADEAALLDGILATLSSRDAGRLLSLKVGEFVRACGLGERGGFMSEVTNRYRYTLVVDPSIRALAEMLKALSVDLVFRSTQLRQLEYKADHMLERMFGALTENYTGEQPFTSLLPLDLERAILSEPDLNARVRMICDYIAGMTDGYAVRTYKRLFDPDFGSIVDLV